MSLYAIWNIAVLKKVCDCIVGFFYFRRIETNGHTHPHSVALE